VPHTVSLLKWRLYNDLLETRGDILNRGLFNWSIVCVSTNVYLMGAYNILFFYCFLWKV